MTNMNEATLKMLVRRNGEWQAVNQLLIAAGYPASMSLETRVRNLMNQK